MQSDALVTRSLTSRTMTTDSLVAHTHDVPGHYAALFATGSFNSRPKGWLVFKELKVNTDDWVHVY